MNRHWINFQYDEPASPERRVWLRREFDWRPDKGGVLRISANGYYTLYINGVWVARGPARTNRGYRAYDTVDLGALLRPGRNEARVLLYHPGVATFIDPGELPAGLWIDSLFLATGPGWEGARAAGYRPVTARCSHQLGFQEHFDARRMGEEAWGEAEVFESPLRLEESGIPPLAPPLREPARRLSGSGLSLPGWEAAGDITAFFSTEPRRWQEPRPGDDAVCYDFDFEVYGHLIVEVPEGAVGTLDLLAVESATGLVPDLIPPETARAPISFGHRITLAGRAFRHELTMPMGFRYLIVVGRPAPVEGVKVFVREQLYPLENRGRFHSSQAQLNRIWQAAERTQRRCMADSYMDCPWREQTQWWGDARVQAQNTFRLASDARLFERGLRQIGRTRTADGLTYAFAPAVEGSSVIPDFSLMWVMTHFDLYRQTGDDRLFREHRGRIDEVMAYFERRRAADGLQYRDPAHWLFLDWSDGLFRDGASTVFNLLWLWTLRELADHTGEFPCRRRAEALERAIETRLYDPARGVYRDGLREDGARAESFSPHAASLAILLDLHPERQEEWVKTVLLPRIYGPVDPRLRPSPYFMFYLFEALKKRGEGRAVLDGVRRFWGGWLDEGFHTTPESWITPEKRGEWSCCHAWSAHPLLQLSELVLGVKPAAPGWREVFFDPVMEKGETAEGVVPTPLGDIVARWDWRGETPEREIILPEGMTLATRKQEKELCV